MGKGAKLLLIFAWLPLAWISLISSFFLLHSYSRVKNVNTLLKLQAQALLPRNGYQFYAALPQVLGSFNVAVTKEDARPEILRQFLHTHDSPLESYAQTIVDASDTNHVDFRLTTAIGMCESNLGKKMPDGSYNAWGYAIYTGQQSGAEFKDWDQGIKVMTKYMADRYYSKGLTTPEQIGPIYAPPSVNTGNSWAKCVRTFMDELE